MNAPPEEPRLVRVRTEMGHLRAQVIKTRLESEGIPVLLRYDSASIVFGLTVDGLGKVEILVPEPLAEQARAILAEGTTDDER